MCGVKRIEYAYNYDKSNLWSVLNDITRDSRSEIPLFGDVLYHHFMSLAIPPKIPNANLEFETEAVAFLER